MLKKISMLKIHLIEVRYMKFGSSDEKNTRYHSLGPFIDVAVRNTLNNVIDQVDINYDQYSALEGKCLIRILLFYKYDAII